MNTNLIEGYKKYLARVKSGEIVRAKQPSMKKAILAKCKDCMCDYVDGKLDCEIPGCSLYHWIPYGRARNNNGSEVLGV